MAAAVPLEPAAAERAAVRNAAYKKEQAWRRAMLHYLNTG
jgi:hypothetical protein